MKSIPMRAVNQSAEQETRYRLNSPLLFGALQGLDPESCIDVLDLAPVQAEFLDYFADYHCRLYLPGCRDELLDLIVEDDQDSTDLVNKLSRLIPLPAHTGKALDLVLLWDLPNYLDKQVLSALITHLQPLVDKHSVLHTYIHTRQHMPERPAHFHLTQDNNVLVEIATAWNTDSPMYYQALLHKVLKPFHVDRGMLLANGLQEYVMRIK